MQHKESVISWLHFGDLHMTNVGDAIGAWLEKHLLGTNHNGRKW